MGEFLVFFIWVGGGSLVGFIGDVCQGLGGGRAGGRFLYITVS